MAPVQGQSLATPAQPSYAELWAPQSLERATRGRARTRAASWAATCLAVDTAMLVTAVVAAQLGASWAGFDSTPLVWMVAFPALVLASFALRGLYAPRLRLEILDDLRRVLVSTTVAAMAAISAWTLLGAGAGQAGQVLRMWAFAVVYIAAGRAALYWSQGRARRHAVGTPTLIVGAGNIGRLVAKRLLAEPELGLQPIGFAGDEPLDAADDSLPQLPVLGASWDLGPVIAEHGVRHVMVASPTAPDEVLVREIKRCRQLGVTVSFVPRLFEEVTRNMSVDHLGGLRLVTARAADPKGLRFALKHAADRAFGAVALVVASPLLLASAFAVLVTMGRPVIYRQTRIGRDGREFVIFKFRTMRSPEPRETEASSGVAPPVSRETAPGGVEGADRRTRTGAFLRKTSIDELPQLFNVLRGDMSLVGPRPERPEFVKLFEEHVDRYGERHRVKSGITGWAQVHGLRGQTSIEDRIEWDNYYIENWSPWLDLKIFLLTVVAVFRPVEQG
jgi:exopolysaccharide biosynthesis polyprenyl glycosylphosphotransferase